MLNGQPVKQGFNANKNELVSQEVKILNAVGFDLDSFPPFFDIVEIMMAQGIIFTTDSYHNTTINEEKCTIHLEKYLEFFVLLSLQDYKLVNTN